jgi:hypothetical protein
VHSCTPSLPRQRKSLKVEFSRLERERQSLLEVEFDGNRRQKKSISDRACQLSFEADRDDFLVMSSVHPQSYNDKAIKVSDFFATALSLKARLFRALSGGRN